MYIEKLNSLCFNNGNNSNNFLCQLGKLSIRCDKHEDPPTLPFPLRTPPHRS